MTPSPKSIRDLLPLIENDFLSVNESDYSRKRLYYNVLIDERLPYVTTRVLLGNNNRTRISFIITTPVGDNASTSLYLSELDIIDIIFRLELNTFDHLMESLERVIKGQPIASNKTVTIKRNELFDKVESFSETATENIVHIPSLADKNVKTPYGIDFSYETLCDLLSLALSTEDDQKLKRVAIKYYVICHHLRGSAKNIIIPPELQHLSSMDDIKKFYTNLRFSKSTKLDKRIFSYKKYSQHFQTD